MKASPITPFIKFFDDKYIDLDEFKTVADLEKLPIYSFKFFNKKDTKIISKIFDLNVIEDLSKLDKNKPFDQLYLLDATKDPIKQAKNVEEMRKQIDILNEKIPDFEKKLIKGIIISQIIVRTAKKKEAIKKTETKIICCGLDNAGKTAILSRFGGRLGIQELMNLEPTKKVAIREIETRDLTLWVWDFGGQEKYRDVYLKEPEKYFLETELVLYVIDVQDPDKFNDSFQYFSQILDIFITLEEKPYILVFIHKSDPDLRDDPEFQLNVELLKERVKELFQEHEFEYDVYITSIFNMISSEPKFSKYLKDVLREQQSLTNPIYQKMEGLGKILDSTLNAVIRLSESIIAQHDIINRRIDELEYRLKTGEYPSVSSPTAPPDKIAESNGDSTRATVLNELKELFQKRKKVNY